MTCQCDFIYFGHYGICFRQFRLFTSSFSRLYFRYFVLFDFYFLTFGIVTAKFYFGSYRFQVFCLNILKSTLNFDYKLQFRLTSFKTSFVNDITSGYLKYLSKYYYKTIEFITIMKIFELFQIYVYKSFVNMHVCLQKFVDIKCITEYTLTV